MLSCSSLHRSWVRFLASAKNRQACRRSPGSAVPPGKIPKSARERLSMLAECFAREDASSWGWGECNNHIRLTNAFRYIPGNAFCRALLQVDEARWTARMLALCLAELRMNPI
eukprot:1143439-Pelagomonas_calceolata.AAC.1